MLRPVFRIAPVVSNATALMPGAIVELVGLDRSTVNVSSDSFVVSPLTDTETVWMVSPGAKVAVPVAAA